MTDIETRSVQLRADSETGTIEGIAVPWNVRTSIGGMYDEMFERGSIDSNDVKLFWQHQEIIGRVIDSEDRDDGFFIRAKVSDTTLGRDALTLMKDGAVSGFSVGFIPVESRDEESGALIVRTKVDLREVSATPYPAYSTATITQARTATKQEEVLMADAPDLTADLAEVRTSLESLDRRFEVLNLRDAPTEVVTDTRTAGEILKAVVSHDSETIDQLNRAYAPGGTTADTVVKNGWVGDLTRLVNEAAPLRSLFASGTLPTEGNFIEYAQLKTDTSAVGVQAKEGDNLSYGKVTIETKTAPVVTVGGYSTLSFQEIERSSVQILNATLNAQAIAAGKALNTLLRAEYVLAVGDSITAGNTVSVIASASYQQYLNAIVDAAGIFQDNGLAMDALVVDSATFKDLIGLEASDGRPVFLVTGAGTNNVGAVSVKGLTGDIAGVTIVLDPKLATGKNAFVNKNALREYSSPLVRLQDQNIVNLSRDFSVYSYESIAHEIPAGIVPLTTAA